VFDAERAGSVVEEGRERLAGWRNMSAAGGTTGNTALVLV